MLTLLIICFIAGALGALLQGMIGVGTGIIAVPVLTFLLPHYGISQNDAIHIAIATSTAVITINCVHAVLMHYRRGNIQWSLFRRLLIPSIIGSCLGAYTASYTHGTYLQSVFALFLLLNAALMVFKPSKTSAAEMTPSLSLRKATLSGVVIGFIASIVGSGGGILMVPFLHSLHLKMRYAVGTSTLMAFPVAFMGTATYLWQDWHLPRITPYTIGYVAWPIVLVMVIAGLGAVPLGIRWATVLPTRRLQQLFALCMVVIGIRMLWGVL